MKSHRKSLKCLLILFIIGSLNMGNYAQLLNLSEGDVCGKTKKNSFNHVCRELDNCASAKKDLSNNINPKLCSFRGSIAIVCCAPSNGGGTTTAAATAPTTVKTYSAAEMCHEYSKLIYTTIQSPLLISSDLSSNITFKDCLDVKTLIVGGTKADPKEFPHMALLGTGETPGNWVCGGSLISNRWILTAAHCDSGEPRWARLGDLDYLTDTDYANPKDYKIIDRKIHPNYKKRIYYNDIALFKLDRDVTFSAFVRPICLNSDPSLNPEKAVASGWGNVETGGSPSEHLLKVTLELVPASQCNNTYKDQRRYLPNGIIDESQICAGFSEDGKDTCRGDSGGPIQIKNNAYECMYTQIGITSFGRFCGIANTPGVYTRVSKYISWIEKTPINYALPYCNTDTAAVAAMDRCSRRRHDCRTFTRAKTAERAACCSPAYRTAVLIALVSAATCLSADARPQTGNQIFSHAGRVCECIPFWLCEEGNVVIVPSGDSENANPCTDGQQCCILAEPKPSVVPTSNNNVNCGYGNANDKVIEKVTSDGDEAQYGEFPWMAVIYKVKPNSSPAGDQEKTYLCGASLIHPQIVLTAAHSIIKNNPNELVVYAGEWDLSKDNEPDIIQKAQVSKIIIHEKYFGSKKFYNDIALVYVTPAFFLSENIGILCLPPQDFVFQMKKCFASGWGKSRISEEASAQSILKRIELPIVPRDICQAQLRLDGNKPNFELHDSFICAGGEIGRDTCQGDGGSPLMCPNPDDSKQFHQAGIVSWGYACGTRSPGVYTDVSKFRNWIDQKMIDLDLNTNYYESNNKPSIEPIPR
ncbi:Serine proteases, trypsin family, serine active site,Peptidase S1, PA clan,Serine proteases, trypsin [Cinara cedri]|uniref:Phenoloxidase-activating factor 2 n=1 Tax=Cinara cedri TaxID=506608 RepID=A0A5E4N0U4_9HEMI|nr:Serine proteases, trypsin family, serine active site,Peptidase S1, PA clan,Serine proteases, trypsin [Cinara cedri]